MKKLSQYIGFVIFLLIGAFCGMFFEDILQNQFGEMDFIEFLFNLLILVVILYASILLHIIIHEAGHLIFGLLSGYKFVSFRIFSFLWIQKDGKISFKRLSIAGTGGQCLMIPPEIKNGKFPTILYNLGGCINNILFALIFLAFAFTVKQHPMIYLSLLCLAVSGLGLGFVNGCPYITSMPNDATNAIYSAKTKEGARAFWNILMINKLISVDNIRIKDIPEDLLYMPNVESLNNPVICSNAVMYCNYLLDKQNLEKTEESIKYLLKNAKGLADLYIHLLKCDLAYIYILNNKPSLAKELLEDKATKKTLKAMKSFPGVIRTEFAYEKAVLMNEENAAKKLALFEKISKTYPNPCEIDSEKELIEKINQMLEA